MEVTGLLLSGTMSEMATWQFRMVSLDDLDVHLASFFFEPLGVKIGQRKTIDDRKRFPYMT